MTNTWVSAEQTNTDVWLKESDGKAKAMTVCCNAQVYRPETYSTEARCPLCERTLKTGVPNAGWDRPLTVWTVEEHIANTASVKLWIRNWTGIPVEDISIEVEWR